MAILTTREVAPKVTIAGVDMGLTEATMHLGVDEVATLNLTGYVESGMEAEKLLEAAERALITVTVPNGPILYFAGTRIDDDVDDTGWDG